MAGRYKTVFCTAKSMAKNNAQLVLEMVPQVIDFKQQLFPFIVEKWTIKQVFKKTVQFLSFWRGFLKENVFNIFSFFYHLFCQLMSPVSPVFF